MKNAVIGDTVEETGTDSGHWIVAEVFPMTRTNHASFARIVCKDHPGVEAYVALDRLSRVQDQYTCPVES